MKSKIFNRVKELITHLLKREESSIPTLSLRYPYSGSGARGIVVRDSYPSQEALSLTCEAQSSVCNTRTSLCEARECFTTKRIGSASIAHPLRKGYCYAAAMRVRDRLGCGSLAETENEIALNHSSFAPLGASAGETPAYPHSESVLQSSLVHLPFISRSSVNGIAV